MKLVVLLLVPFIVLVVAAPGAAVPEGQLTWAVHISLAPTWFDPGCGSKSAARAFSREFRANGSCLPLPKPQADDPVVAAAAGG